MRPPDIDPRRPAERIMSTMRLAERASALLHSRGLPWLVAALFAAAALVAVHDDRYLHDEGLLTYIFTRWVITGGIPAIFFLKVKPVLCLLNLPGVLLGLDAFLIGHVLMTAIAVAIAGDIARRGRLGDSWLVALMLVTSPLLFAASASGLSNADGVLVALIAIRIAQSGPPEASLGIAIAALPLVRFELGMLSFFLFFWSLQRRPTARFWVGLVVPVLLFVIVGALYHRDVFWPWHFAPAYGDAREKNPVVMGGVDRLTLADMLDALALVTPAFGLALFVRPPKGRALSWVLSLFGLAFTLFTMLTPFARALFGFAPRYYLIAISAFAFTAPMAIERLASEAKRPERLLSIGLLAGSCGLAVMSHAPACAAACGGALIVAVAAAVGRVGVARLLLVALLVAWPQVARSRTELERVGQRSDPEPIVRWLQAHPALWQGRPVYTNLQLLDAYVRRSHRLPGIEIQYIVQTDVWREIREWTNPRNGQTRRIEDLVLQEFYGRAIRIEDILGGRAPAGALLLLNPDPRLVPEGAEGAWRMVMEPVAVVHEVEVARVLPVSTAPARQAP